jgi:hypothetical protein
MSRNLRPPGLKPVLLSWAAFISCIMPHGTMRNMAYTYDMTL